MARRLDCVVTINKPADGGMKLINDIKNRLYINKGKNLSNCEIETYELKAMYGSTVRQVKLEIKDLFMMDCDDIMLAVADTNLIAQVTFTWHNVAD